MVITKVKGRRVVVRHPSGVLFSIFSDLNNLYENLPSDLREKFDLKPTTDTLVAHVMGFHIGIIVEERIPFSSVKYIQFGKSPVPFTIWAFLDSISDADTEFHIELDAELHGIFTMMSGKLQEAVDKVTDEIERGLSDAVMQ